MPISSSVRMWLGSITFSGLLLASSLPTLATTQTQTTTIRSLMKTMTEASIITPNSTYTEAVRKQMKWISKPVIAKTTSSVDKHFSIESNLVADIALPTKIPQTKRSTATNKKPVRVVETSLEMVSRSDSSEVVDHALSLRGIPYVFGGSSRKGFDCSGLTQYVYRHSGVSLPRTASEQFRVGSSISRAQLQSGDLVFFSTYAKGASHVGIYIGGGRFVSASNNGVSISSLASGYYAGRYIGARRP
ncbi:C40 family peptidase [Desulfosporosinus sp. OT]|uniref:C40 family peptidase n=1 Tax=Desulfosporosinus sp. OT TaxID=913865 RepID=UPI0002DE8CED|nr:C40 family peptidase [Desulfosporosinus sp. OT]